MKNLEEIKNEVAVKHGYADWLDLMTQYKLELKISYSRLNLYIDEVAEEYAKQCCDDDNKWIAIESESDLPKESTYCWFIIRGSDKISYGRFIIGLSELNRFFLYDGGHYDLKNIIYYMPIQKPRNPNVVTKS